MYNHAHSDRLAKLVRRFRYFDTEKLSLVSWLYRHLFSSPMTVGSTQCYETQHGQISRSALKMITSPLPHTRAQTDLNLWGLKNNLKQNEPFNYDGNTKQRKNKTI